MVFSLFSFDSCDLEDIFARGEVFERNVYQEWSPVSLRSRRHLISPEEKAVFRDDLKIEVETFLVLRAHLKVKMEILS